PNIVAQVPAIADPGPLGLAGFALTTFVLSAHNAGWAPDIVWIGLAFFYGGIGQFAAGMWEFKNRNVFGATAFSTYGAFWLSLGTFVVLITVSKSLGAAFSNAATLTDALGWFLLAFLIFNTYMLIASTRVTTAVFVVFLTLEVTEALLAAGFFAHQGAGQGLVMLGGVVGVVTALCAWYASAAGVINGLVGRAVLPVGGPLWHDSPAVVASRGSIPPAHAH
ncbi:MAG: acetate uptake transporter, partial [Acidimicrobiales bacterium]